jgi:hypothetical protein
MIKGRTAIIASLVVVIVLVAGTLHFASAAITVTIVKPTANQKFTLPADVTFNATAESSEHPEKNDKIIIMWEVSDSKGRILAQFTSQPGQDTVVHIGGPPLPSKNSSFGLNDVVAVANVQQFSGTGYYYGAGALDVEIIEEGGNFLGYILNCLNPEEQDMVIATDTSTQPGCSYSIAGYCTDAHKGVPSYGVAFGPPWTSDSQSHWAYWVRQAVTYGVQNSYGEGDSLDAVWEITDPIGLDIEILNNIGYPENGPTKNGPSYDFFSSSDTQGWTFAAPPPFNAPTSGHSQFFYGLTITPQDNSYSFGFWNSPATSGFTYQSNCYYSLEAYLISDLTDSSLAPQVRLRVNSANAKQVDTYIITSTGSGESSPAGFNTYQCYFVPSQDVIGQEMVIAFDVLNFDPTDAVSPILGLSSMTTERHPIEDLGTATALRTYSFDTSAESWAFSGTVGTFSAPLSNTGFSGLLDLTSTTNTNTFGFWASPTTDITIQDYILYRAQFTVGTDISAGTQAPIVRLRLYSANNQVAHSLQKQALTPMFSNDYVILFDPPTTVTGQGLGVAFDILNFDPSADPQGRISLDSVTITYY